MLTFNFHIYGDMRTVTGIVTDGMTVYTFAELIKAESGHAVRVELVADNQNSIDRAITLLTILKDKIK